MYFCISAFYRDYRRSVWFPYLLYEKDDVTSVRWLVATRRCSTDTSFLLQSS